MVWCRVAPLDRLMMANRKIFLTGFLLLCTTVLKGQTPANTQPAGQAATTADVSQQDPYDHFIASELGDRISGDLPVRQIRTRSEISQSPPDAARPTPGRRPSTGTATRPDFGSRHSLMSPISAKTRGAIYPTDFPPTGNASDPTPQWQNAGASARTHEAPCGAGGVGFFRGQRGADSRADSAHQRFDQGQYLPTALVGWEGAGTPAWRWIAIVALLVAVVAVSRSLARLAILLLRGRVLRCVRANAGLRCRVHLPVGYAGSTGSAVLLAGLFLRASH